MSRTGERYRWEALGSKEYGVVLVVPSESVGVEFKEEWGDEAEGLSDIGYIVSREQSEALDKRMEALALVNYGYVSWRGKVAEDLVSYQVIFGSASDRASFMEGLKLEGIVPLRYYFRGGSGERGLV